MALCGTGNLGLIGCPQGACSSIGTAMYGASPGQVSLVAMFGLNGMSCPNYMSNFHGFNGDLCVCPTPIASISAAGATPNTCAVGVSPNTFTTSTSCSWLHPAAPSAPSLAGTAQNVTVDANAGAARSGTVCYTPSHCGARQDITFCQLAGITCKCIVVRPVASSSCGGATTCATVGICATPALTAGDCFCANLGAYMNTGGQGTLSGSFACWRLTCNGVSCVSCTIPGNVSCCPSTNVLITSANISLWCMMMCASTTSTGCPACSTSMGCIIGVTSIVGCEVVGSPNTCQMYTG